MNVAYGELGVKSFPKGSSNPRITEYHQRTNIQGYDDKAAWCSSFANWVIAQVGITGTGSAFARSWLDWGDVIDAPKQGCIVILEREDPKGWQGHVGFYLRTENDHIVLLGGNQLNEVCEHHYDPLTVLGFRWPAKP